MHRRLFFIGFLLLTACQIIGQDIGLSGVFDIPPVAAQTGKEHAATIKIGKHPSFVRIVFSGIPDEYVQKASVILTGNNIIKVDFQSPVTFKTPEKGILKSEAPLEIASGVRIGVKGSSCSIAVENLDDINVSKLSTPTRLVIDAYISKPIKEERAIMDTPIEGSSIPMETFIIDPGHGGYDSGIRGKNFVEKDFVMSFARDFSHMLEKKGKKVFLTRKGDQVLSIKDRVKAANQKSPEIFISLHISSKNEFGIYTAPKMPKVMTIQSQSQTEKASEQDSDKNIANAIASNIKNELGVNVRRERLPLSVIAYVNAPALLIELPNPEKFHYDKKNRERLINIVLKGIASSSAQGSPIKNGKGEVSAGGK
ncbi:MAG: N-acetylmuramoyl-L-alanine amidase family protein [Nitrospirota bacterium]